MGLSVTKTTHHPTTQSEPEAQSSVTVTDSSGRRPALVEQWVPLQGDCHELVLVLLWEETKTNWVGPSSHHATDHATDAQICRCQNPQTFFQKFLNSDSWYSWYSYKKIMIFMISQGFLTCMVSMLSASCQSFDYCSRQPLLASYPADSLGLLEEACCRKNGRKLHACDLGSLRCDSRQLNVLAHGQYYQLFVSCTLFVIWLSPARFV
jgi:hypothetical protein